MALVLELQVKKNRISKTFSLTLFHSLPAGDIYNIICYNIYNITMKDIFGTDHLIGPEETITLLLMIAFFSIILQTLS